MLKALIGLPYSENSKIFSCHGLASWDCASKFLSLLVLIQIFLLLGELLTKVVSLSYPWVYYRSSPLLGVQPTKANERHLFGWYPGASRGGRSRTRGLRHSVNVMALYGAHPYQHPVIMLTPLKLSRLGKYSSTVLTKLLKQKEQTRQKNMVLLFL